MKKISIVLLSVIFFLGCEKEINITPPTILIENSSVSVLDTVTIKVEEYADIDGDRVNADYYNWFVEDTDGVLLTDDFPDSSTVNWIPQIAGYFLVKVKIGYDNNKSITAIKELTVKESSISLQTKMAGDWTGHAIRNWGPEWDLEISFDNYGFCSGRVTSEIPSTLPCLSIFFSGGTWYWDQNGVGIGCDGNSNYPCQRILITEVDNNVGKGKIWIGMGDIYGDSPATYKCYDTWYNLEDLTLKDEASKLYFKLIYFDGSEEIQYELNRK